MPAKLKLLTDITSERRQIVELVDDKIGLGFNVVLEYTRTIQEIMSLEEEVVDMKLRLKRARKPMIRVTI